MDAEHFARLRELYEAIAELPPHERADALARRGADAKLAAEALALCTVGDRDHAGALSGVRAAVQADAAAPTLAAGEVLGTWRIVSEIGRGGMATVYLAVQESLGREVALKLLSPLLAASPTAAERFQREGRIAAKLVDRHIVGIYDVGVHEGQPYLVMEYMPGGTLSTKAPHAPGEALEIVRQVALALDHAHREGVIHRDLKPDNILRRADGSYALGDFGVAYILDSNPSLTQEGTTLGTPHYMSPEQLKVQPLDGRADLYSLGVVLYQLLTGELPYSGTAGVPVGMQHAHAPLPRLPEHLARYQPLLDSLLSKSPDGRPGDAAELVRQIEALQAAAAPLPMPAQSAAAQSGVRKNVRPAAWIAAALALLVLLGATWRYLAPHGSSPATVAHANAADKPVAAQAIAVLPFVNAGGDPNQQFFSDGLSENLITELSKFDGLTVIGRASSFQFRDTKDDSETIGAKLGVTTLLEGSVQHAGDEVRVSAELIRAADGHTLWAERYDRPYKDLFALEDEITQAVSGALEAKLLPGAGAAQSNRPASGNLDAYSAYLQGKYYWNRGTEADLHQAIKQFETATRLDPHYAAAWAVLSRTLTSLAVRYQGGEAARKSDAEAHKAAATALSLAPDLAVAHTARGDVLLNFDFDWHGAETEYDRAGQLSPDDGSIIYQRALLIGAFGHLVQAIDLLRQALIADPLNARTLIYLGTYQNGLGRLDEAEATLRRVIALQPDAAINHVDLAITEILRGDAAAALEAAQGEPAGPWRDIALGLATQIGSDRAAADAALKQLIATSSDSPYQIAQAYALRKDADKTFEWLDRAWIERDAGVWYLLSDPLVQRYKDDPRFAAFRRKVGLPETTDALSIDAIRARLAAKPTQP